MNADQPDQPDEPGEPDDQAPEVGSTAEEAVKLLGALTDWARDQSGGAGDDAEASSGPGSSLGSSLGRTWTAMLDAHVDTGAPECSWCPVCRTVHVVRHTSPEVRAHLATAASS